MIRQTLNQIRTSVRNFYDNYRLGKIYREWFDNDSLNPFLTEVQPLHKNEFYFRRLRVNEHNYVEYCKKSDRNPPKLGTPEYEEDNKTGEGFSEKGLEQG